MFLAAKLRNGLFYYHHHTLRVLLPAAIFLLLPLRERRHRAAVRGLGRAALALNDDRVLAAVKRCVGDRDGLEARALEGDVAPEDVFVRVYM